MPSKTAVGGDIYFELPSYIRTSGQELLELFRNNEQLIPWFPPVLLGEDYHQAVEFLKVLQPKRIVTDNTGIAFEAMREEIDWLAGSYINIVNSFSLKCLQEKFNCVGAFISTELNRQQIKKIQRPADFELHFSIFHPIALLTSRQCLLQQVTGCEKSGVDAACLGQCQRSAVITPEGKEPVLIHKRKGHQHTLYHHVHCLNTDIVTEVPDLFSGFCVDFRDIRTETVTESGQAELIRLFTGHLAGDASATMKLRQVIHPTTNRQYAKGL
jgi:putative protease